MLLASASRYRRLPTSQRNHLNFKLFRERVLNENSDAFIANLSEVDIVRATWKHGAGNTRIAVPGLITTRSDVDLVGELLADQAYFLAGADGDRFDFEISETDKSLARTGNLFKIVIL
jgi:hypothetical protein